MKESSTHPEFPDTCRVVIIGGGAVGASCLYHLARAGWTDCVLLERNELTSGSTWHAAGNVPTFSSSWSIMNMQRYSTELFARLATEVDYQINYHVTGSIRLAHSRERMLEFERAAGMGRYQGMELVILDFDGIRDLYPFIETHDLLGALHDPNDGDIDPAQLTQALAKGARDLGARVIRFAPVEGIERKDDEWLVTTPKGTVRCEYVVNAAGYYAQRLGELFRPYGGRTVPMATMSHQYILTNEIDELVRWTGETGHKLPLLRDVDVSYYLRQEKHGLNLGPYERNCRAHWTGEDDPLPEDFSFQLFEDDLDRLEDYLEDAMERVPILGTAGIAKIINGPIPYTPDGNPLIGPMPGVRNAFEACVFTFGIAQAGGAGKVLAEWVTEGQTEWDMWSCDPRRFTDHARDDYCVTKAMEVYGNEYAIHFPHHEWPAGRPSKTSTLHQELTRRGAQFGAYNGWERANWFASPGDDTSQESTLTWNRNGPWEPRIREECLAVHNSVGVLDLPGFARFNVSGSGAADWLLTLVAGRLPTPGRMNLCYFPDDRGRVLTEMSVLCHDDDHFTLITASTAQWHDLEVLRRALPSDSGISITDHTDDYSTLIVSGPESRSILTGMTDADLERPWLSHQTARVADQPVALARVSFAGELGWEIHAENDRMPAVYAELMARGVRPFGMYALDSLRIEKAFRTWKGDLSTDYTLLESGLKRFVKLDKPGSFRGKAALQAEMQQGSRRGFTVLEICQHALVTPYMSTIWHGDEVVGETTSGAYGYRVDKSLALAIVKSDLLEVNTQLEVEIFGQRYGATVLGDRAPFDPLHERLRS